MLSVGIDVGTTTTQVVFSELTLVQGVDRPQIADKKVLYRSRIQFTPLGRCEQIDAPALDEMLRREYRRAGIAPEQIALGAAIITGETAKKRNAEAILQSLASLAGDFVVAVAGPNLESIIAGRGSGAAAYSQAHFTTVANVDVGGGTANSAIFQQGQLVATAAINVGGRLLQIDPAGGLVRHVAEPAQLIIDELGLSIEPGRRPTLAQARAFTDCLADSILHLLAGTTTPLVERLMLTAPLPVPFQGGQICFSGGVGRYIYDPIPLHSLDAVIVHGDVGPLLAESIRQQPALARYQLFQPLETVRATVMGASSHTVSLSGNTIWVEDSVLPLKNVPVVRPRWAAAPPSRQQVNRAILEAIGRWDVDPAATPFGLLLSLAWPVDYPSLLELATGLSSFAQAQLPAHQPLLIVMADNYARVLGQLVKGLLPDRALIVIDQVDLHEGDYIDLAFPVLGGQVVPLSIKTLLFYR